MIPTIRSEKITVILIFILFSSYYSFSISPGGVYYTKTSDDDKFPSSISDSLNEVTQVPVFRVLLEKVIDPWNSLDPLSSDYVFDTSPSESFFFDTLVDFDFLTGEVIPSLAQNWVVSNDSKQWLFILREDVSFHDGSQFDASVVKFNFDRLIDPNHPAYVHNPRELVEDFPLESVEVISEYRVLFTFSTPYAPFINVQASSFELISPNSFHGENFTNPIGTGPYKFSPPEFKDNKTIFSFPINSNYFRGLPPFEQVILTAYQDHDDYINAILNEEGDITESDDAIGFNTEYWHYSSTGIGIFRFGWLNQQRVEFTNRNVRLAVNYAVNKSEYMSQITGRFGKYWDGEFSVSFFPRFLPYWDSSIPGYPYNVTKANELLDEAGYPRNSDGYRFDLTIKTHEPERAEYLVPYLDAIGINCTISILTAAQVIDDFNNSEYDMVIWGWVGIYDPSFIKFFFHSNGTFNTAGYSNLSLDSLFDLADQSPVSQEREFYFKQIQNITHHDAPYLLLPDSARYYLLANHLTPFVKLNKNSRPNFNYLSSNNLGLLEYSNITISSKPFYFPFADAVLSPLGNQDLNVSLTMTYELGELSPSFSEVRGKFYQVAIHQEKNHFRFRCYYDLDEIVDLSLDMFYRYDFNSQEWIPLEIISSNTSLRFVEVELQNGFHFLSFGRKILFITYKLVPMITLLFSSVLFLAVIVLFYNQTKLSQIKRRYNL